MDYDYEHLLTVGEFAKLLNTTRATLVHYDDLGILKPAKTAESGYRYYLPTQAQTYLLILLFSECGLKLKDIKGYLASLDAKTGKQLVEQSLAQVDEQLRRLMQVKRLMESKRAMYGLASAHEYEKPFIEHFAERRYFQSTMRSASSTQQQLQTDHSISICRYVADHGEFPEYPFAARIKLIPCEDGIEAVAIAGQDQNAEIYLKPAGDYACILHKGTRYTIESMLEVLANHANEQGYQIAGDLYMTDTVNFVITNNEEEYSTLFQVRVVAQEEGS